MSSLPALKSATLQARSGERVTLDATDFLGFSGSTTTWAHLSGPAITLDDPSNPRLSFVAPTVSEVEFLILGLKAVNNEAKINVVITITILPNDVVLGPTCSDGIQNGDETGVDCGGSCPACPPPPPACGDGVCDGSEDCESCAFDCGECPPPPPACGDGVCDETEDCASCASDCGECPPPPPACGDGVCDETEDCASCASDCGECTTRDPLCGSEADACHSDPLFDSDYCSSSCPCAWGEGDCDSDSQCQDGLECEYNIGADFGLDSGLDLCVKPGYPSNQPMCSGSSPTPTCNDGVQNGDETGVDCGGSCTACTVSPSCNDGVQNGDETGVDCGGSCPACVAPDSCGDGVCGNSETCLSCASDCGTCPSGPADTVCDGNKLCVFPGAEGFGVTTAAGRGGRIIHVTNLNDSGTGSLRAALEASGARIVVFDVSGMISLQSIVKITDPYITIAGQTAPAPGITLRHWGIEIKTHDVLLQHLRVRVGDETGSEPDGVYVSTDAYNVVVDHVSISWAIDENFSTGTIPNHDVTISNSIIAEALNDSTHSEGPHSKGFLLGEGSERIACVRNVFAHNYDRQLAYHKGGTSAVYINNISYDAGRKGAFQIKGEAGPIDASVVGNVAILGSSLAGEPGQPLNLYSTSNSRVYLSDNPGFVVNGNDGIVSSPPLMPTPMTIVPGSQVESSVLQTAGAYPAFRDAVDVRVINQVKNRTGRIIDDEMDVGGWPVLAENKRTFVVPANPNSDDDGDGYTNIEEELHRYAAIVEGR